MVRKGSSSADMERPHLAAEYLSQYYYRMLKSQKKELVEQEMLRLTEKQNQKLEFIKNPVIAEFLGFGEDNTFTESGLETSIILRAIANRNNDLQSAVFDGGAALCAAKRFVYTPSAKATMWLWRLLRSLQSTTCCALQ